jgi:protease PrsW
MPLIALAHASLALAPVLLFLLILLQGDSYKLISLRAVLALVAVGVIAGGAGYLANAAAYARFLGDFIAYSTLVSPWIEEALKAVVIAVLIRTRRVGLPVDAGIAGFAVGTGFALLENGYYLATRPEATLAVQVIRGFGTAIMHGGTTTILAMVSVTLHERRPHAGLQLLLPGYLAAVALHAGFNVLLARPLVATLATIVVLPLAVYLAFGASEQGLKAWLEEDLDSNVELLDLIRGGEFLSSRKGHYLSSLQDRFRGEDLADMLCLLRVHGELAVRAKGILLMRESGLEAPALDEETREKLAELAALERAIGRTGRLALRPLLATTGKALWQLRLLTREH